MDVGKGNLGIVVPAYNEEGLIEDALSHLDDLSGYFNDIHIVDDASDDGTGDIIREYLESYDTDIEAVYLSENSQKVGAIREGVSQCKTDNIVLMDADSKIKNPDELVNAQEYMERENLGGLGLKVVPSIESEDIQDELWQRFQDLDYSFGRLRHRYTSSFGENRLRHIAGAGGMYKRDVLERALEDHSGRHEGDDIETTAIMQLKLGENVDYYDDLRVETEVPTSYKKLLKQRFRWDRGVFQSFSEHPAEHLGEIPKLYTKFGHSIAYELVETAVYPVAGVSAAIAAANGDTEWLGYWYLADSIVSTAGVCYSACKGEIEDKKSLLALPLLPLYRAATFFPPRIGAIASEAYETVKDSFKEVYNGLIQD